MLSIFQKPAYEWADGTDMRFQLFNPEEHQPGQNCRFDGYLTPDTVQTLFNRSQALHLFEDRFNQTVWAVCAEHRHYFTPA